LFAGIVVLVHLGVAIWQIPQMLRNRQKKELAAFVVLMLLALYTNLGPLLDYQPFNPTGVINKYLTVPVYEWLTKQFGGEV